MGRPAASAIVAANSPYDTDIITKSLRLAAPCPDHSDHDSRDANCENDYRWYPGTSSEQAREDAHEDEYPHDNRPAHAQVVQISTGASGPVFTRRRHAPPATGARCTRNLIQRRILTAMTTGQTFHGRVCTRRPGPNAAKGADDRRKHGRRCRREAERFAERWTVAAARSASAGANDNATLMTERGETRPGANERAHDQTTAAASWSSVS